MIEFESGLELDLIYRLDVDPAVRWFESQPLEVTFKDGSGCVHTYTPDFLVRYASRPGFADRFLYEVKYMADLEEDWDDLKARLEAAGTYARERGWIFCVQTEYEIRTDYLWNAKLLWEHYRRQHHRAYQFEVLREMDRRKESTIAGLIADLRRGAPEIASEYTSALYQMLALGQIKANLETKLTGQAVIWK